MSGGNQSKAHTTLVHAIYESLGRHPLVFVCKTNASSGGESYHRGLPPGWSDLFVLLNNNHALWIEVKTGAAGLNANQKAFRDALERVRGNYGLPMYVVARSVADADMQVAACLSMTLHQFEAGKIQIGKVGRR